MSAISGVSPPWRAAARPAATATARAGVRAGFGCGMSARLGGLGAAELALAHGVLAQAGQVALGLGIGLVDHRAQGLGRLDHRGDPGERLGRQISPIDRD